MARITDVVSASPYQFVVYAAVSLSVLIATGLLAQRSGSLYRPFFGRVPPLAAVTAVIVLGGLLLTYLLARGGFVVISDEVGRGLLAAGGLAMLFALIIIVIDLRVVLPEDINRPYPDALLFYYSIAFVVEIVFHLLPLTLLLAALTTLLPSLSFEKAVWPCIFVVALLEPIFQNVLGFSRPYPWWIMGLIAINIFLINFAQLALFKRYDFVSMYALRLVYYLLWHIIWGLFRLRHLF